MKHVLLLLSLALGSTISQSASAGTICYKNAGAFLTHVAFSTDQYLSERFGFDTSNPVGFGYNYVSNGDLASEQIVCSTNFNSVVYARIAIVGRGAYEPYYKLWISPLDHGWFVYVVNHGTIFNPDYTIEKLPDWLHNGNPNQRKD